MRVINPIIEKELKIKMRGWKAPALITAYLGFLGIVIALFFISSIESSVYSTNYFNPRSSIEAYNVLALIQLILILFITPAMTGGAICGERERQTLDLLLCTNLSPLSIVTGKVFVSIAHVMLLITASLPIMGTVFLYGGIGISDLLLLFTFYCATALMIGSMGIFYSTIFRRSSVAIIVTYITIFILTIGTPIIFFLWARFALNFSIAPTISQALSFMFCNPMFAFGSVIGGTNMGRGFMEIFNIVNYSLTQGKQSLLTTPWIVNIIFDIITAVVFILLASWKIKPVKGRIKN